MMDPCREPPPPLLIEGLALFNAGEFFEQHETLETLWRAEPRPVRAVYQGILQIGVAFHHLRRGNHHGTVVLLERGLRRIGPFRPVCHGVDVERLHREASAALDAVRALGPAGLEAFDWQLAPRVHVTDRKEHP
jgi:hypothetical protein